MNTVSGLYIIINAAKSQSIQSIMELVKSVVVSGVKFIQYRDKVNSDSTNIENSKAIQAYCKSNGAKLIINDRLDIANIVDADGIHLGQQDILISYARSVLGAKKIIGGSASTIEQAKQVAADGADYVGFGHIFPTSSKHKSYAPVGLEILGQVCHEVSIPVIAIGGINQSNIESVLASGADGVAIISALQNSDNPYQTCNTLINQIKNSLA